MKREFSILNLTFGRARIVEDDPRCPGTYIQGW